METSIELDNSLLMVETYRRVVYVWKVAYIHIEWAIANGCLLLNNILFKKKYREVVSKVKLFENTRLRLPSY